MRRNRLPMAHRYKLSKELEARLPELKDGFDPKKLAFEIGKRLGIVITEHNVRKLAAEVFGIKPLRQTGRTMRTGLLARIRALEGAVAVLFREWGLPCPLNGEPNTTTVGHQRGDEGTLHEEEAQ